MHICISVSLLDITYFYAHISIKFAITLPDHKFI